jgi:hypothetical protein
MRIARVGVVNPKTIVHGLVNPRRNNRSQNMASTSIQKLYEHGKRAQETLKRLRLREREATNGLMVRAGTATSTLAGLCLAGAIDGKYGHDSETEHDGIATVGPVPINAAVGLICIAAGIPGMLPGSEYIATFGAATLGYPLAKTIERRVSEGKK